MLYLESAVTRLYVRFRKRLLLAVIGVWFAASCLIMLVSAGILIRIEDLSSAELWDIAAWIVPVCIAAVLVHTVVTVRGERDVQRWLAAGADGIAPEDAWLAASTLPRRTVLRGLAIIGPPYIVSGMLAICDVIGFGIGEVGFVVWGLCFAAMYSAALAYALGTITVGPVLEDISRHLPRDFAPPTPESLGARVLVELLVATFITGVCAIGYSVDRGVGADDVLGLGTIVTAGALVFALPLAAVFTERAMRPVRALTAGTRRVAAGDLGTTVPLVARDEFGELIVSFNAMLEELTRKTEDLRASQARIVAASDAERRRMERDLHDGAQQRLTMVRLKLSVLARAADDPAAVRVLAAELMAQLEAALVELRELAHGIYPAVLERGGLPDALAEAAARTSLPVTVDCDGAGRYGTELETAVYFCCLEALQNAAKHAGASATVTVELGEAEGALRFAVADDGEGFVPRAGNGHAGLGNMADRVGALGGTLRVESAPGAGTCVEGRIPLASSRERSGVPPRARGRGPAAEGRPTAP